MWNSSVHLFIRVICRAFRKSTQYSFGFIRVLERSNNRSCYCQWLTTQSRHTASFLALDQVMFITRVVNYNKLARIRVQTTFMPRRIELQQRINLSLQLHRCPRRASAVWRTNCNVTRKSHDWRGRDFHWDETRLARYPFDPTASRAKSIINQQSQISRSVNGNGNSSTHSEPPRASWCCCQSLCGH